jgi:hypothetical protein
MLEFRPLSHVALAALALLVVAAGCGGDAEETGAPVTIEAGDRSPALPGAAARFAAPADRALVDSARMSVVVEADRFETGVQTETARASEIANSGNGQHFHVIVDNQPYLANYEAGTPFQLGELQPGAHTLLTFPSRSYHESVKHPDAYDLINVYVKADSGDVMMTSEDRAIIYSRPKGRYEGEGAERIMLDFYLHNVELSDDGYKARYTIADTDGAEVASITLTEWAPAFATGLDGTYNVTLELLDADGTVVPGPFNTTTRKIRVQP